jgi:hypothetical protein
VVVEVLRPNECVHCGRTMGDYEGGYGGSGDFSLCHPNVDNRPDCYHMVTVYHHPLTDCARCQRDPWEPLTPVEQHDAMIDVLRRLEAMIQDVSP